MLSAESFTVANTLNPCAWVSHDKKRTVCRDAKVIAMAAAMSRGYMHIARRNI
jgi:hypothetical protein